MRVQAFLIILISFQACSYSVSPEVIDIIATQFSGVNEDGYVDADLTDEVRGTYIDKNGRGFSYAMGLNGQNRVAYTALGDWAPEITLPSEFCCEICRCPA